MRLWHKNLISVLPTNQLRGQWRECCAIAKNISVNGSPNHILVNRILDYPMSHFYTYGFMICAEMKSRDYKCDLRKFIQFFTYPHETNIVSLKDMFKGWHNDIYLRQCLYNLEEKAICDGIPNREWVKIVNTYGDRFDLWNP